MTAESTDEEFRAAEKTSRSSGPHFSARDLLTTAIFVVIYFAVAVAINMLGVISPAVLLFAIPLSVLVTGIPYMLFLARVKHSGMVLLFGAALAVLYLLLGHPWIASVLTVVLSLVGELVMRIGRYRSVWAAVAANAVFSLWSVGPMLPLVINRGEYLDSPGMQAMGEQYTAAFDAVVTGPALLITYSATLVCGVLGGLLGAAMLRKHFVRAGLA